MLLITLAGLPYTTLAIMDRSGYSNLLDAEILSCTEVSFAVTYTVSVMYYC